MRVIYERVGSEPDVTPILRAAMVLTLIVMWIVNGGAAGLALQALAR